MGFSAASVETELLVEVACILLLDDDQDGESRPTAGEILGDEKDKVAKLHAPERRSSLNLYVHVAGSGLHLGELLHCCCSWCACTD